MSKAEDRNLEAEYQKICHRAAEGDLVALALMNIINAALEDKISDDQLRMVRDVCKRESIAAGYKLFLEFYRQSLQEGAVTA
ncbi:hypothetical protein [Brevibacillus panacihumi]|uniref:Uncharacterized protein n=1 Tax=Brevibacillus panacihumi TaxID=497735 RepID=A0A3M8C8W9_9BACL|nr:hypothetical protein [Brevibacillus panacihumi]RNB72152.1 hypothetical protein EDM58_21855 [Brevibacillus panacihumi]